MLALILGNLFDFFYPSYRHLAEIDLIFIHILKRPMINIKRILVINVRAIQLESDFWMYNIILGIHIHTSSFGSYPNDYLIGFTGDDSDV